MTRKITLALIPLLVLLFLQPGCDGGAAATSVQAHESDQQAHTDTGPMPPEQHTGIAAVPMRAQPTASTRIADVPDEPAAPSAFVVIQNAGPKDPKLLVRQLQQVLPKTQVVKQVQSSNAREIKLEVTNIKDLRALANKIPFASVESIDLQQRTITVDFDL